MKLPDHINPIAVDEALLNIGMTINEIRELTGNAAPQIIRTREELEALDPDTLVLDAAGHTVRYGSQVTRWDLPLAVIASADQVRAARKSIGGSMNTQYTFFWLTGNAEVLPGNTAENALNRQGYGLGAIAALDFYASGDRRADYRGNDQARSWESLNREKA